MYIVYNIMHTWDDHDLQTLANVYNGNKFIDYK